jgi:hypothetical protein
LRKLWIDDVVNVGLACRRKEIQKSVGQQGTLEGKVVSEKVNGQHLQGNEMDCSCRDDRKPCPFRPTLPHTSADSALKNNEIRIVLR